MKILFIAEFFPSNNQLNFSGGVEAYNYFLVRELTKKNKITVICRGENLTSKRRLKLPFKIIRIGKSSKIDTSFMTIFQRVIFNILAIKAGLGEEFDLVQGNNFVTYIPAFIIGFVKRKPSIAWYPDVFIGKWIKLTGFFSGIVGEISERVAITFPWAHFIALSNSTKNKLLKTGIKVDKISTIYAGADLDFFTQIRVKKRIVFTICCISRLVNYKRLDLLIKAAAILKKEKLKFQIEIFGDGPEKENLLLLINRFGLDQWIKIESNLTRVELGRRLKSAHLFCLPSEQEGFGLSVIEAAACSLPYVVSNISVFREITHRGQGGLFFKQGSHFDLAKKIKKFIQDKKLEKKSSQNSFELAKRYSWEQIAQEFEQIYQKIITRKLKILVLVDAWFPHIGGGQVHAWELSKQLAQKGCKVTILTRDLGGWGEQYPGVEVIRIGRIKKFANIWGRLEYLFYALFYSLFADYDIFHAHAFSPGLIAPFVKIFRNKPTVYTVHGKGAKIAGLGFGEVFLEDLVTYKIPYDLEITVAKNTITKKISAKKSVVIPNGVDIAKFAVAKRKRTKIKNILYVGRLSYEKGVDILIEVFNGLKSKKLKLFIVGEGEEFGKLKKMVIGENINFLGRLTSRDLINAYKKADLLVIPSRTEGQPLILFEAWVVGLPILATKVGDNKVYIKEGISGFLSKPDIESLRNGIRKVLKNKSLDEIIANGEKNVKNYSWDIISEKTLNSYRQIL
ncbi:glycosyltransferase family 4 protein [Candidatus Daviesbacteria bacterium]|nr:glycosyltransferase family 4 protein [Candidatus Daviesbacteria bacterium]